MLRLRQYLFGRVVSLYFCSQKTIQTQNQKGTQYTNWVLARAAGHNHNITHLKRKLPKDRYSIHRLTNLNFMEDLVKFGYKYNLTMNEKIILLAQFNHIIEVLGKRRFLFNHLLGQILAQVNAEMQNPPDLICLGTLMSSLVTMQLFNPNAWIQCVDSILANKFDQEYDELFGIVISLAKYRQQILSTNDYLIISRDPIIPQIPIIYRNSLNVLRQFVSQNIYNLKQCRLLFQSLYQANINQSYFWDSVRDWFNIYTKQQLGKKEMDQYFIMKQSAIDRILHDHGIIRPRPILQELCSIVYVLSQFGNISWRFVEFAQDLVLYSIDNGSKLFKNFQEIQAKQLSQILQDPITINAHIKTANQQQSQKIKQVQKKYRTIFINPIALKNNFIVYFLVILSRAYKKYRQTKIKEIQQQQRQKQLQKQGKKNFYDNSQQVFLDPRVKKWLFLQLVKPEMQYTVKQLLIIQRCKTFLQDANINIVDFICQKLQNLRQTNATFTQISQLMHLLHPVQYNKMNQIFSDFLQRNHPSQILKFTKLLQSQHLFPYMSQYMLRLPKAVNSHEKYYSFQQNCYFILMLLQNAESTNSVTNKPILKMEYEGQMQQLKQSIKIITYSRGFKLSVNSYFHKIMDYIDVVEFFQGGRS